jgi:hypothetical protein
MFATFEERSDAPAFARLNNWLALDRLTLSEVLVLEEEAVRESLPATPLTPEAPPV